MEAVSTAEPVSAAGAEAAAGEMVSAASEDAAAAVPEAPAADAPAPDAEASIAAEPGNGDSAGAPASAEQPGGEAVAAGAEPAAAPEAVAAASAREPEPAEVGAPAASGKRHKRVLTGTVVSNGAAQSVVVRISRRKKHRLYKKYRNLSKKVMAHDPGDDCQVGDLVRVIENRPLSKMKRWRLVEIVKRAS